LCSFSPIWQFGSFTSEFLAVNDYRLEGGSFVLLMGSKLLKIILGLWRGRPLEIFFTYLIDKISFRI
jgi:hypothetical protein